MNDDVDLARELDDMRGGTQINLPSHLDPTEDAVALLFAKEFAGKIVFDHTAGHWFIWRESRWQRDTRHFVFSMARDVIRAVRAANPKKPEPMGQIRFTTAVEKAARADPKLSVTSEVWNTDRYLLGTPGGIVDLRSGELRAPSPDLYISRYTSVAPSLPGTAAPAWQAFLASATGNDEDMQAFLQRLAGYWLTGDVTEEALTFLYGIGGSGKGTFIGAISGIMGEYAVSVPIETFTANSRLNGEYYRATMAGARLVTATETETQATWAESQIKELTGNETPISARQPYGQPFTYWPQFKISLVGNHAPKLKGRSAAMERRLRILPFDNIPPRPDPALKDRLKAEYPAILRWMLDGCLQWQVHRLGTTDAIRRATANYFESQDAFRHWLDDRCILDPGLSVAPGKLCADFNAWAKANGGDSVAGNDFAELIDRTHGLKRGKWNGVRLVRGIGLRVGGDPCGEQ